MTYKLTNLDKPSNWRWLRAVILFSSKILIEWQIIVVKNISDRSILDYGTST